MSHFPPSTANGVPANLNTVQKAALECLTAVEEWFSQQLAYFAQKLIDLKEADGSSVLDNTVLLSVKDISEGVTHGYRDVPHVILGGKGLFKPGHFALQNRKTSGDLYATIAQALGYSDVTSFGDPRILPARSPRSIVTRMEDRLRPGRYRPSCWRCRRLARACSRARVSARRTRRPGQ